MTRPSTSSSPCATRSIAIESVTVSKPSLDEVFLALTGHDTGEHEPETGQSTNAALELEVVTMTTTDRPTR